MQDDYYPYNVHFVLIYHPPRCSSTWHTYICSRGVMSNSRKLSGSSGVVCVRVSTVIQVATRKRKRPITLCYIPIRTPVRIEPLPMPCECELMAQQNNIRGWNVQRCKYHIMYTIDIRRDAQQYHQYYKTK